MMDEEHVASLMIIVIFAIGFVIMLWPAFTRKR